MQFQLLPQLQTSFELPSLHFQELLNGCIDSAVSIMLSKKPTKTIHETCNERKDDTLWQCPVI